MTLLSAFKNKIGSSFFFGMVVCFFSPFGPLYSQMSTPLEPRHIASEYEVKANLLAKLLKYVRWSNGTIGKISADEILIGVVGENQFKDFFEPITRMPLLGKPVRVHHYGSFDPEDDFSNCHILFISKSEQARIDSLMAALAKQPTLTVSEFHGFLQKGGMINLLIKSDHIVFEIHRGNVQAASLAISSQVLRRAIRVIP